MLRSGGHKVDTSGFNGTVAQHIGQPHDVLAGPVENGGEQVPQIVRKHLGRFHSGGLAQPFQLCPNLAAAQRGSVSGEKNLA